MFLQVQMTLKFIPVSLIVVVALVLTRVYRDVKNHRFIEKYRVYHGVYEANPGKNNKLPSEDSVGYPAEIQRLDALIENFDRTHEWTLLLRIGDMYARGCFPRYAPDDSSALKIYTVASKCYDPDVACLALSKCVDLRKNPVSRVDRRGESLPRVKAEKLVRCVEHHLRRVPLSQYLRRRTTLKRPEKVCRTLVSKGPETPRVNPQVPNVNAQDRVIGHTDPQNVHDHGVAASVRENVKAVIKELEDREEDTSYDRQELIESVMIGLRDSGLDEPTLNDAFRVIVSLVPDNIESVGCSQMDVLNATFRKIERVEDSKVRMNLVESLGKNLASGVEKGNVVCSTGKIGRIITTLEGVDHQHMGEQGPRIQKSIPLDVIRTEISSLASKVRTDVLAESSKKDISGYNASPGSHHLSEKMDRVFRDRVKKIYIEELKLSDKVLSPIVETYSSVF